MSEYLQYIKNPFVAGAVIATIAVAYYYFEERARLNNPDDIEPPNYAKIFLFVFVLIALLVYYVKGSGSVSSVMQTIKHSGGNIDLDTRLPDW